jgi:hypothetical protein
MKTILSLLAFLTISFSAYGQFDHVEPEPRESDIKTEFRHSIFQANYLTQNLLIQFLEENREGISFDSESFNLRAKDLYYEKSTDFKREKALDPWLKLKYLTPEKRKLALLDSALNLNKEWKESIIEDGLLDEILKPIHYGYDLSIKNNTIYAVFPSLQDNSYRAIYKFEFDKDKKILSKDLGRLMLRGDSLFWLTSAYAYKNHLLYKEINKKCNDAKCSKGYELETKTYSNGQLTKNTKQVFSRNKNELIQEDVTDYIYSKNKLESATTNTYKVRNSTRELYKTAKYRYKKGKITNKEEAWINPQNFEDRKSYTEHKYDRKDRLVSSEYKGWDNNNEISQVRTEEFEYLKNHYIYRYKQTLKKERGKKKLPLQYELTYTFY